MSKSIKIFKSFEEREKYKKEMMEKLTLKEKQQNRFTNESFLKMIRDAGESARGER